MTLWHEHDPVFVGSHAHATDDNAAEFEHTHDTDGTVVTAGSMRWKRPKSTGDGTATTLDVQSTVQTAESRFR